MAAVTFYHLKTPQQHGKMRLVCQLVATAYRNGHKVYVNALDEPQGELINSLLWTYAPNSFIPHTLLLDQRDPNLEKFPVVIGHEEPPEKFNDVLISLRPDIPGYTKRFQRVVEPVDADTEDKEQAKVKFEQYQSLFNNEPKTYYL